MVGAPQRPSEYSCHELAIFSRFERWGVQQSQITATYRFAEPSERAAAILLLEHHLANRTRLPEKLETVGDHIRRKRLTLKLLQRQVAQQRA